MKLHSCVGYQAALLRRI